MLKLFREQDEEKEPKPFDPETLNDPIALKTEWRGCHLHHIHVQMHELKRVNSRLIAFKHTNKGNLFFLTFIIFAIGLLMYSAYVYVTESQKIEASLATLVMGLGIGWTGFYYLYA